VAEEEVSMGGGCGGDSGGGFCGRQTVVNGRVNL